MKNKLIPYEITKSILKKSTTDKGLAWFWGALDTHCDLISKGVRPMGIISPFWKDDQHKQNYPEMQELIQAYGLKIKANAPIVDDKKNIRYWRYYIYSKGHLKEVNQIISLFQKTRLISKMSRKQTYPLHRQIGHLLGYSQDKIYEQYPDKNK